MSEGQPNYFFVNTVRFWSMVAIVCIHSLYAWGDITKHLDTAGFFQMFALQACKFASPAFFIISGFLLGDRLPKGSPWVYFRRRWNRIGAPWFFWASMYGLFFLFRYDLRNLSLLPALCFRSKETLLYSIYWFVPNSLFSLGVLLTFRRFLDSRVFGGILFGLSAFWGCNAYVGWLPVEHTSAIAAFVSYLWLGNWSHRNYRTITAFLQRLRFSWLYFAILLTGLLAMLETIVLITDRKSSQRNDREDQ